MLQFFSLIFVVADLSNQAREEKKKVTTRSPQSNICNETKRVANFSCREDFFIRFHHITVIVVRLMQIKMKFLVIISLIYVGVVMAYDPEDKEIETIIPKPGDFEAFYPRETQGISNSVVRAPHAHGSFFQHRNPGECRELEISYIFSLFIFTFKLSSTSKMQPLMDSALMERDALILIEQFLCEFPSSFLCD